MTTSIRVDFNVPIKMRDGVTLRADVFRPDDKEKHPAIIVRTPYSKIYSHHFVKLLNLRLVGFWGALTTAR